MRSFQERMKRRQRVWIECDDDHAPHAWTVIVRPGSRCTLIHNYCGPMNPDCNFIETEVLDGPTECPICGQDFTEYACEKACEAEDEFMEGEESREDVMRRITSQRWGHLL